MIGWKKRSLGDRFGAYFNRILTRLNMLN